MGNIALIFALVLLLSVGVFSSVRHFRGSGGCCGGTGRRPRRKHLRGVTCEKLFRVGGMHCKHCKARVEEIVNGIDGMAGKVDLRHGLLRVRCEGEGDDVQLRERLGRAGYTLSDEP